MEYNQVSIFNYDNNQETKIIGFCCSGECSLATECGNSFAATLSLRDFEERGFITFDD